MILLFRRLVKYYVKKNTNIEYNVGILSFASYNIQDGDNKGKTETNDKDRKADKMIRVKKILTYLGLALVLLVIATYGIIEFTNRPDFCRSCHYMEPYYDAWARSSHKDVPCALCHYPPGYDNVIKGKIHDINQLVKYATNAYRKSKPWAEIEDASCLREGCHDTRLLEGTVMFGDVKFNHKPHLTEMRRGRKLRCTSCHSQIVQGDHMTVTATTCVLCHFKDTELESGRKTDDCLLCHDPSTEPKSITEAGYDHTHVVKDSLDCRRCHGNMIVGDGAVQEKQCYFCHWDQDRLSQFSNSELMHTKHITENKIECEQCHQSMEHKWKSPENAVDHCDGCHEGMHQNQLSLFSGTGGSGIKDHPSPMYGMSMSCQACHVQHNAEDPTHSGVTSTASGSSCEPCHGRGYDRLLSQWDGIIKQKVTYLGDLLNKLEKTYTASNGGKTRRARDLLRDAGSNLDIVRYGKPVHNIVYSNELLFASNDNMLKASKLLNSFVEPSDLFSKRQMVPSDCRNCHATIDNVSVKVNDKIFDHGRHLKNGTTCSNCHTNQRRHGQTFSEVNDCQSCHHRSDNCQKCHPLQYAAYQGGELNGFEFEQSIMAEAELTCLECHQGEDDRIVSPTLEICADCHDDDYIKMGREWQDDVKARVKKLEPIIALVKELNMGAEAQDKLASDIKSISLFENDKSAGLHNYEEVMRVLDELIKKYEAIAAGS